MYQVTLLVNKQELKAKGKTLYEALCALKKPEILKTIGIIEITFGEKKVRRVLNIPKLKALFNDHHDVYRQIMAKNLSIFIK